MAAERRPTSLPRLLSGWAAGGLGLLMVSLGGWWFTIGVGVMVHIGLLEFFRLAQFKGMRPATKSTLVACQLLLICTQWADSGGLAHPLADAVLPVAGAVICGMPWPFSSGMALTLITCLMIVGTDIGSYVIGRRFGRHPLSPISPGKTVEGAFGGLACSMAIGAIGGTVLGWSWGWLLGAQLGALVTLFSLVGDLTESMMKRDAGVKDSGDAIPGHGGMLDRIDSYLFTPAMVFSLVTVVLPLLGQR